MNQTTRLSAFVLAVTRGAMSLAVMGCLTPAAWAATVTETFNTGPGNFIIEVANGVGGNSLAWSNTDNTGPTTSGAGEFGGVFARTPSGSPTYVAASLGGSLTRADNLNLSGRFIVTAQDNMDGGIVIGYLSTSQNLMLGFQLAEPNPGPELRTRMFAMNDGIGGSPVSGIALNTPYDFNLTYNPSTHELSGNVGPIVFNPTATGLSDGVTFDTFAILSGTAGSSDPPRTATAYFDDLTYNNANAAIPGDVNNDGFVDIFDINVVSSNWGSPGGPTGDANGDGNVDIFDINLISTNWMPAPGGAAAVPEPASIVLLGSAMLAMLAATRRRAT